MNEQAVGHRISITREFDAPPDAVFRAWTDPDELSGWYGPGHLDIPRDRIRVDLRVGGRWELTMVRPDNGGEYSVGYEIVELAEPELLVMRSDPMPGMALGDEPIVLRLELEDLGGRTRMTLSDGPYAPEGGPRAEAAWNGAFDKLAATLAS